MKSKLVGAGLVAGAAWATYYRLRKPQPFKGNYASAPTKILIVGGGVGGLAAARELASMLGGSEEVGVALLDRVNYTTFWPMVPSVIPRNLEVRHVAHSIRPILRPLGIEFFQDEVTGLDFEARQANTDDGAFSFDYLILSPGSRTTYFGTPGAKENTMDTKGLRNALQICNQVIDCQTPATEVEGWLGADRRPYQEQEKPCHSPRVRRRRSPQGPSRASAQADRVCAGSLERSGGHLRQHHRHTPRPFKPRRPEFQAPPQEGGTTEHSFPRPASCLCHPVTVQSSPRQSRSGDPRALQRLGHHGCLLSRPT